MTNDFLARADADAAKRNGNGKVNGAVRAVYGDDYESDSVPYPTGDPVEDARRLSYALSGLERECARMRTTYEGSRKRNDTLNDCVFRVARFIDEGILAETQVADAFADAAASVNLPATEIRNTTLSALSGRKGKPANQAIPPPTETAIVEFVKAEAFGIGANADPDAPGADAAIFDAEQDFWERESLKAIYDAALCRLVPPWAVLAHCVGRALAFVRPGVRLPPIIGGNSGGSLNWFAAIAGDYSEGKSTSEGLAKDLVPGQLKVCVPGSGEGICNAYLMPKQRGAPQEYYESILFSADEVDNLTAQSGRQGSTTMPILRSAFSGGELGFSYAKPSANLGAHSYRLVFTLSGQPARYRALLADRLGGTPQRFQWFPAFDLRYVYPDVDLVAPLSLPSPNEWRYPRMLTIPDEVRDTIINAKLDRARRKPDALNGHMLFWREKFAYGLALLDERTVMTAEDWRLSGIAAEVSERTRNWVLDKLKNAEEDELIERGRGRGVEQDAAELERARRTVARADSLKKTRARMAERIVGKLAGGPVKKRDLDKAMSTSANRLMFKSVMEELYKAKAIGWDKEETSWFLR